MIPTSFQPDIVIYNIINSSLLLFELTCPLDSNHHLSQAWSRKQSKVEYQQILAELDRLDISNYYETLEISTCDALCFIYQELHNEDADKGKLTKTSTKPVAKEWRTRSCRQVNLC